MMNTRRSPIMTDLDKSREIRGGHKLAELKLTRLRQEFPDPNQWQRLAIEDAERQLENLKQRAEQEGVTL